MPDLIRHPVHKNLKKHWIPGPECQNSSMYSFYQFRHSLEWEMTIFHRILDQICQPNLIQLLMGIY